MLLQNPILIKPKRLKEPVEKPLKKSPKEASNKYSSEEFSTVITTTINPIKKKKNILPPGIVIINACTLNAVLYCTSSILFYAIINILVTIIHLPALNIVVTNCINLIQTKKLNRTPDSILTTGAPVILFSFATPTWANCVFLWRLLNNSQTISCYE